MTLNDSRKQSDSAERSKELLVSIAKLGAEHPARPSLHLVNCFKSFFDADGKLIKEHLDKPDGVRTRREIIARFLLLSAVLDQGPDIEGIRQLIVGVTNDLYEKGVRILHRPLDFFEELGISINEISTVHGAIRESRASEWAKENFSNPKKYNLFMDNSKQLLNYAVFRWGSAPMRSFDS